MVDGAWHIKSLNWDSVLVVGRSYMLRQRFFKGTGGSKTAVFDVAYSFTYNGYVLQDQSTLTSNRVLILTNRRVFTDTTGIVWNTPKETVQFWLPFSSAVGTSLPVFTACGAYSTGPDACGASSASSRRYGNAGIIGSSTDSNDPAGGWAPHMNAAGVFDIIVVHQAGGVYGSTSANSPSAPISLQYWISPLM